MKKYKYAFLLAIYPFVVLALGKLLVEINAPEGLQLLSYTLATFISLIFLIVILYQMFSK